MPLNTGTPTPLEDLCTFKGGDLAYGKLGESPAMQHLQHIASVDNLEAEHNPTPLSDLVIAEDAELDYGSRGEGIAI